MSEGIAIKNYDALVRRATKMVKEFDLYPLMPTGNLSIESIEKVFRFNPLFVLDDLKKQVADMLLEQTDFEYDMEDLEPILQETYYKYEKWHKGRILEILEKNFKSEFEYFNPKYSSYMSLRPEETKLFHYAFSIFYISRDIGEISGCYFARVVLGTLNLIRCEKSDTPFDGIEKSGKLLDLSIFERDRQVYDNMKQLIEAEIEQSNDEGVKKQLLELKEKEQQSSGGCYIATCVYGSYDCPQVWTLRRYRDDTLAATRYGRAFIKAYYAISPRLVELFGATIWFKKMWRRKLDRMIAKLQANGVASAPYEDKRRR